MTAIKETFALALQNHQQNNLQVAEKLYKNILNIDPNHLESVFLLGSLSAQNKNFEQAKQLLQKAILINPKHAQAHYNLGLVFIELSEMQKAKDCFERVIQIQPNYTDAHNNLGNLLKESGDVGKAISCYEKAIQINPNYINAHNNLGTAFQKLEEFQKAKDCYEKAIQIQPNYAEAYYNLGLVFKELGEFQKEKNCYEKAIQIQRNHAEAHHNLGLIFQESGDVEKAISCYERATQYKSKDLVSFYHLSELKRRVLSLDLKNKVVKIIKGKNCTKKNLVYGNFLLSRCEFEEKNYEKEFNYLVSAHNYYFQSKKEKFEKEVDYWLNQLPNTKGLFDFKNLNKRIKKDIDNIKPIFIIGVPRCGSTLVEKIIASSIHYIPIGEETSILSVLIKQKINQQELPLLNLENFQTKVVEKYKQKGLIQERNNYTFTDKSLDNFFYIGLIKQIFPNAKIVDCRRNALCSIMSILKTNLIIVPWAHNLEHIFKYFDIYYRTIENYKEIFPNFIYELQYEKLVNNPEEESKKLLGFCDLPWDKKCLEFYKRKELISKTASNIQIRKPIYKDSINKYIPYKQFLYKYVNQYSWFN